MSEKDVRDHQALLRQTGKFRLSREQEETINRLMGDLQLELEEDTEPTLELPGIRRK